MAKPLIEDSRRKVFIQPEFKIDMGIKWTIRLAQQPPLPIRIAFFQMRCPAIEPLLPLHVDVHQHLFGIAGIRRSESPPLFIDIPFLLNVYDLSDAPRTNDVPYCKWIGLAAMLRSHLHNLFGLLDDVACLNGLGEYVRKRLFNVAILSSLHHFGTQLGMLEVARGNHHSVNVLQR